jgi:Ca2+/H+ antiporter
MITAITAFHTIGSITAATAIGKSITAVSDHVQVVSSCVGRPIGLFACV